LEPFLGDLIYFFCPRDAPQDILMPKKFVGCGSKAISYDPSLVNNAADCKLLHCIRIGEPSVCSD
jgi:hypothetical protein